MLVNEIFYSIQGEGPNVGRPSVFLRLAGCNLQCVWCDTKYTWLYSENTLARLKASLPSEMSHVVGTTAYSKDNEIQQMDRDAILAEFCRYVGKNAVITGGEPLLQKDELSHLVDELIAAGYRIEIETNGTLSPGGIDECVQFNVSPKLSNSHVPIASRYKPDVLKEFIELDASIFKFVIQHQSDLTELEQMISELGIAAERVFLMPEGTRESELLDRGRWLIEVCKDTGYNYSHRLHVQMFGSARGV